MERMKTLENRMQVVETSISDSVSGRISTITRCAHSLRQEIYLRDLNHDCTNLQSTEDVDLAKTAATTSYKDWSDYHPALDSPTDVTIQGRLTKLLSSGRRGKKEDYTREMEGASKKYHEHGEPKITASIPI
jgi:hypothetical protein